MPNVSLRIGIVICLLASPALAGGPVGDPPVEIDELSLRPSQRLPFNPLTFEAPPDFWEQLTDHRFWTAIAADVVLATGLVRRDQANELIRAGETLMAHPELKYEFRVEQAPQARFQVELKEVHGGPWVAILVTW